MPPRPAVLAAALLLLPAAGARADTAPQSIPFAQAWADTALISVDDDWSAVPGATGYRGDGLTSTADADPQAVTEASSVVDVAANQTGTSATFGGVAEFELADPVVALQPSSTADAPSIVFSVDTRGLADVSLSYRLRDLDASADDAVQQFALQYRVGATGGFTNVAAGYVADATTGPSDATQITPVTAALPTDAEQRALVEARVLTTNASGSDEWVGVDDVAVNATPSGSCSVSGSTLALQLPAGGAATISRAGEGVAVTADGISDASCGGVALAAISTIAIAGTSRGETFTIELGGGAFGSVGWSVDLDGGDDALVVLGSASRDRIRFGPAGGNLDGDHDAELAFAGVEKVLVDGRGGDDALAGTGAFGDDVGPFTLPLVLEGGEGADKLTGGRADDVLSGGPGDDTLDQLSVEDGADAISGGDGVDILRYSTRRPGFGITIVLDGLANDGGSGGAEGDAIGIDVEAVFGGRGDDVIRALGEAVANKFVGGPGDDALSGGGGPDSLYGEGGADRLEGDAGDDKLRAGDGVGGNDTAAGGEGRDICAVDPGDATEGCER